ncbi:MAG: quinol dehydrogenase ferredoxin subunit NapH [Bacteroidetes bacterium 4572_117]|nr:MAG: quinol dehydrogenase ferredoxin subunit NapH [Bacteroidetes bacterium 4572_117]
MKLLKNKYLILRRFVQISILLLFFGGNYWGWQILIGNFSTALLFDSVPLSDPYAVLQILASGFIVGVDLLIGGLIVFVVYGLLAGRMFCAWVCPMNIVADFAIWLNQRLKITTNLKLNRKTRYGVLVLGLVLSPILGFAAFEAISPVAMLHRSIIFGVGASWQVILAIFFFDIAVTKYGWCGHLCPLGAFYSTIGRFSIIKVNHNADNCTNCMKCFKVCHEVQVLDIIGKHNGFINSGECTNCARCIEVCEDDALTFSIRNLFVNNTKKQG